MGISKVRLSDHFTLRELTKSQIAERKDILNTCSDIEKACLQVICNEILEPVRNHYGIPFSPSSGYRCLELNREIGSADTSQHILGQAVDFEVPGVSNMDLAQWIMANLEYDQLLLEFYREEDPSSGWVHCSYVENPNRKKAFRFDGKVFQPLTLSFQPS
jgi:zinc D-Ala-D-Ala carboxypeptidase